MTSRTFGSRGLTLLIWLGFAPLRQSKGRAFIASCAIALGVALGFGIYLVNRSAADEVVAATRALFGEADLTVQGGSAGFDENLYPLIAHVPGVVAASPVIEVVAPVPAAHSKLTLIGVDPFRVRHLQPALVDSSAAASSSASLDTGAILLSAAAASNLGLHKGAQFSVQIGLDLVPLRVAGVLPVSGRHELTAVMDIADAQWRLHQLGRITRLDIKVAEGAIPSTVQAAIAGMLPAGVRVTSPQLQSEEALLISRAYRANLSALALVALFTGGFLVFSTQSLAVVRRRREIGLLHALGVTAREQLLLVLASAFVIGAVGAVMGTLLGAAAADIGLRVLGADLGAGYFRAVAPSLAIDPLEWLVFFLLGIIVAVLSSVLPAVEAAAIAPATAMKSASVIPESRRTHGLLGVASILTGALALLLPPIKGLPLPGYLSIALLLIGTVLTMPSLTRIGLRYLPASRFVVGLLGVAHLRGSVRFVTASVASILVSFSLMVAMAIMVTSFRVSLESWMERLLQADIYLRAGSGEESTYFDSAQLAALRAIPGVERVEAGRSVEVLLASEQTPLVLVARPINVRKPEESLWMISRTSLATPPNSVPVWISEAAADLSHLRTGMELQLPVGGHVISCFVRGVWRDYEHQSGAIAMDYATYVRVTGDGRANGVRLWLEKNAPARDRVIEAIRAHLPSNAAYEARVPADIRANALRAFDRTFAVTYVLEAMAVLIGVFGLGATSSAQVLARRAEFGMLRCVGLTRRQVIAMLALEGASLGLVGVISGLVLGWIISFILVYVVNRQSFHWSMDVFIPELTLVVLSLVLIASAAITAVVSGRQATSEDAARAVKEDW